jgi:hypothetical protein
MPRDPADVLREDRIRLTHMLDAARRAKSAAWSKIAAATVAGSDLPLRDQGKS